MIDFLEFMIDFLEFMIVYGLWMTLGELLLCYHICLFDLML